MKLHYRLFRRQNGIYFCEDRDTHKQESLRTKNKTEATRLLNAKNEARENPLLNRQIARTYLAAVDPELVKRSWRYTLDELIKTKCDENARRWGIFSKDRALAGILDLPLIETRAEHFLAVLNAGTVSTNVFLRRLHNFALGLGWLLAPVLPPRQWPKVRYRPKRGITRQEHEKIIEREQNPERRAFYQLLWELGGSQGDIAQLNAEDIDWSNRGISYSRAKTGQPARVRFDEEVAKILVTRPSQGPIFPYLRTVRASDRATEFRQRCKGLKIEGVTLHSYRYSWAERARECGYPERLAQEALGHGSKAVHRAYARGVNPEHLTIGEWKKRQAALNVVRVEFSATQGAIPTKQPSIEAGLVTG
jgi:integrase